MKIIPIGRNRVMAAVVVSALFAATSAVAEAPAGAMTASDHKPPTNESLMRLNAPRIAPLQDVLILGSDARMNIPGLARGNWRWRFTERHPLQERLEGLRGLTSESGRLAKR